MDLTIPLDSNAGCEDVKQIFSRIADRWTILVIIALRDQSRRFNETRRYVGGVSPQMLARTLRSLERDGMLRRTVHDTKPPQVEYTLTELGHSLVEPLLGMAQWAATHYATIDRNRIIYDAARD